MRCWRECAAWNTLLWTSQTTRTGTAATNDVDGAGGGSSDDTGVDDGGGDDSDCGVDGCGGGDSGCDDIRW